jgi:hypothetical protein
LEATPSRGRRFSDRTEEAVSGARLKPFDRYTGGRNDAAVARGFVIAGVALWGRPHFAARRCDGDRSMRQAVEQGEM